MSVRGLVNLRKDTPEEVEATVNATVRLYGSRMGLVHAVSLERKVNTRRKRYCFQELTEEVQFTTGDLAIHFCDDHPQQLSAAF